MYNIRCLPNGCRHRNTIFIPTKTLIDYGAGGRTRWNSFDFKLHSLVEYNTIVVSSGALNAKARSYHRQNSKININTEFQKEFQKEFRRDYTNCHGTTVQSAGTQTDNKWPDLVSDFINDAYHPPPTRVHANNVIVIINFHEVFVVI